MRQIIFIFLIISQTLLAQSHKKDTNANSVSNPSNSALSPRLTTDHKGNPVVSWAEQDDSNNIVAIRFAISYDGGKTFTDKKNIPFTGIATAHAEGMPKIAFKSDGTIIATYETKRPVPESRFAGDLKYTLSTDGGQTWATPQYVHTDTSAGKSRSFSDLVRLPNGEIGISWLGEAPSKAGRPVKFAQTTPGKGFSQEVTAKEGACQCCRTNLYVDTEGGIHIFFRDIMPDGTRDMGHIASKDGGKTFGDYRVVYADKWKINACPHTGPSTAQLGDKLYTAWYTGEDKNVGVKVTDNAGSILTHIKSANARHPQLTTLKDRLVLTWDESEDKKTTTSVKLRFLKQGKMLPTKEVSQEQENATFPSILSLNKHILVAYESEEKDQKKQIKVVLLGSESLF